MREGSEGAVVRALALLGMAYVRQHSELALDLATGYDELAAQRAEQDPSETARAAGMRANMTRRTKPRSATRSR